MAFILLSGCSNNQAQQSSSSDIPTVSTHTATDIAPSHTSQTIDTASKINKPDQIVYDPKREAAAIFQGGSELSDKDIGWFINAKPDDDKYGLNLYMSHDFFDLSDNEKNTLTQKYFKQWKASLKAVQVKVPRNTALTINFYDVMSKQFIKSKKNNEVNEVW